MKTFMFPGQGSQFEGMGRDLFPSLSSSQEREIDDVLGYSLRELCLESEGGRLRKTEYTQPSLYVVNALFFQKCIREGSPKFVAGHSLGEFNALLAAGVFDFVTGLQLVKKRGELMSRAHGGGMAAVVGLPATEVLRVIESSDLGELDVANFNAPLQTVVAGPSEVVARAPQVFSDAGAQACVPLPVSAAFHSRYMRDAAEEFRAFLSGFQFRNPEIPVISNVTARPYPSNDSRGEAVKDLLARQIYSPVQWLDSVEYLLGRGSRDFLEVGPGNVLTKLVQKIRGR